MLFVALTIVYLLWSWSPVLGGLGGDNANYLLMARYYSPYSATSGVAEYFAIQSIYPPLFPLLLGIAGGGESLLTAHLITTLFLLGSFAVFYWWLLNEHIAPIVAFFVLLSFASLPGIYLQTLSIHSENLYILFSLWVLACASSIQPSDRKSRYRMIIAVVALACAYLTRGAGLSLSVAWLFWLWINRNHNRYLYSLLAVIPILLWSRFGGTGSTDYWEQLVHGYQNPVYFFNQIGVQAGYLFAGWIANFGTSRASFLAGCVLLFLGLSAAVWRTVSGKMDGFYVWVYIAMITLWPFPAEAQRLVLVLIPVLLWQIAWACSRLKVKLPNTGLMFTGVLTILLVSSLPEVALTFQRYHHSLPPTVPADYKHTDGWYAPDIRIASYWVQSMAAVETDLSQLNGSVPPEACIFAIKPSVVALLADRVSKAPPKIEQQNFDQAIQAGGCNYFYLLSFTSPTYPSPLYPYQRLQGRLEIIRTSGIERMDGQKQMLAALARIQ